MLAKETCLNNPFLQLQMEKSQTRNQQISIITYAALRKYSSLATTPNTSSRDKSSLMAEVGAREVLGPDSIIPLHIFLAVYSTWNDTGKRAIQHHFLPGHKHASHCSETWPVQVLCSTAWRAASEWVWLFSRATTELTGETTVNNGANIGQPLNRFIHLGVG